jgi:hypothetical protein
MSTTDELLEEMLEDAEEYATPVTDDDLQFWIDEHLRVISIPKNGVVAGVEGDKNVNKIKFGMNRYYHGFDMSTFSGRILYSNAKGNKNYYNITDMQTNGNTITFSWLVDADAVQYMGKTAFVVYLFKTQGSELRQKFYSTLATLNVLEGMEVDSAVPVEKQTDIIERMKEEISAYAEEVKKSLPADYTAMTEQVSSLKEDLDDFEGVILPLKYINIFNKENIVKGKIYNPYVNAKDTEFQIVENGFYSTDKYFCKQGDVIYYSAAYIYLLIYDKNGNCVEVFNPTTTGSVIVSNSNAEYFRYTCSASDKTYVDRFALSINKALPDIYIPYGVTWEQYNNNKNFYMPKVIVSVDYSFSEITNPHITYGLENGIRFVFNGQSENARTLLKKGCDLGTYSNDSDYLPDFSTINNENDKDLKAWDDYVKHALSLQENKGFVRPVLWECFQLRYGTALEKALKNNGYIYARGKQSGNGFYPVKNVNYQQFDCIAPTDTTLDNVKTVINNCCKESKTLCILFHRVLDNVPSEDTWDISTEYYKQIIDYILEFINAGKIINVTPNELYNLSNPINAHIRDNVKLINLIN